MRISRGLPGVVTVHATSRSLEPVSVRKRGLSLEAPEFPREVALIRETKLSGHLGEALTAKDESIAAHAHTHLSNVVVWRDVVSRNELTFEGAHRESACLS